MAEAGQASFIRLLETVECPGAYSPDAESAGRRALHHAATVYLSVAEASPLRAATAFEQADNMTDLSQALMLLVHHFPGSNAAAEALAAFEERFRDNPLVIDKWLSIQATAPGEATLERVRELTRSPLFLARQPEPRALADRGVRLRQPDRLQPPRRRRAIISSPKRCWRSTSATRSSPPGC